MIVQRHDTAYDGYKPHCVSFDHVTFPKDIYKSVIFAKLLLLSGM